jgi:lysophospholipase L1-like esterase
MLMVFSLLAHGQQAQSNRWETEIEKFEEADRNSPPPKQAVLFIGSSSIRLWQNLAEDFPKVKVINRGFGGSELGDSVFYTDRIVVPYQPKTIVLYAGDNDLAAGKTPQQVFADYKLFVERVRQKLPHTKIAYISIKPSPARITLLDKAKEVNRQVKAYAEQHKKLAYIDVFTPMLNRAGAPRPELFGPDKLHMNRSGYELWKSIVARYIR